MPVLRIDIEARFAEFQDSLNRIQRQTSATAQQMQTAFAGVGRTLAALGVGISVAGLTAFAKSAIDSAAVLDDLSEKTGASVEELSKLQQVATISGTSLDIAEQSLIRLAKAIEGTDDEAKGAGAALKALGLSAEQLRGLDTAEALRRVAIELDKFADGSGKTALAIQLLGRSGAQALPFLKDLANTQGIQARVTTEQAAQAEELQKAFGRFRNETQGLAQSLALQLLPVLTRIIGAMGDARREGEGFFNTMIAGASALGNTSLAKTVADAKKEVEGLSAGILQMQAQLSDSGTTSKGFVGKASIDELNASIAKSQARIQQLQAQIKGAEGIIKDAAGAGGSKQQLTTSRTAPVARAGRAQKDPFQELLEKAAETRTKAAIDELRRLEEKEKDGERQAEEFQRKLDNLISNTPIEQTRKMQESVDFLNRALELGRITPELYGQAIESLVGPMKDVDETARRISQSVDDLISQTPIERAKELQAVIDELSRRLEAGAISADQFDFAMDKVLNRDTADKVKKTNDAAKELGLTFSSAFEDAVVEGKKFSDVLKGIEKDILRILTRKLVTEPLTNEVSKIFEQSGSGGSGGGVIDFIGKFFKGIFGTSGFAMGGVMTARGAMALQHYASGGIASSPQFAVFGEGSQPEAFVPLPDGRRIPVEIQNAGGGRPIVIQQSFAPGTDRSTVLQAATRAGQAVQRALDRNG